MSEEIKQVLVIRRDLKMRRGKEIAQAAHAAVEASLEAMTKTPETFKAWFASGTKKVTVYVQTEEDLLALEKSAINQGLVYSLITDCGKTEFHGVPTKTVIAIGPSKSSFVDKVTGNLTLY